MVDRIKFSEMVVDEKNNKYLSDLFIGVRSLHIVDLNDKKCVLEAYPWDTSIPLKLQSSYNFDDGYGEIALIPMVKSGERYLIPRIDYKDGIAYIKLGTDFTSFLKQIISIYALCSYEIEHDEENNLYVATIEDFACYNTIKCSFASDDNDYEININTENGDGHKEYSVSVTWLPTHQAESRHVFLYNNGYNIYADPVVDMPRA